MCACGILVWTLLGPPLGYVREACSGEPDSRKSASTSGDGAASSVRHASANGNHSVPVYDCVPSGRTRLGLARNHLDVTQPTWVLCQLRFRTLVLDCLPHALSATHPPAVLNGMNPTPSAMRAERDQQVARAETPILAVLALLRTQRRRPRTPRVPNAWEGRSSRRAAGRKASYVSTFRVSLWSMHSTRSAVSFSRRHVYSCHGLACLPGAAEPSRRSVDPRFRRHHQARWQLHRPALPTLWSVGTRRNHPMRLLPLAQLRRSAVADAAGRAS
jgi:hypothetical protein